MSRALRQAICRADHRTESVGECRINGRGGGVFSFTSDAGDTIELSVLENKQLGTCVRYNIRAAGERKEAEFYSVSDPGKMNQIEDFGDDQSAYSLGRFRGKKFKIHRKKILRPYLGKGKQSRPIATSI